jgi:Zn finger protein HypA/HybF involved in hydrogenase expression
LLWRIHTVILFSPFGHEARAAKIYMAEGYCVKCKAKKEIANGVEETMKNGRKAIKGKCPTCGTVMFKILGGKAVPSGATPTPPAATG